MSLRGTAINRTQALVLAFFMLAWAGVITILAAAPQVYDQTLGRAPGSLRAAETAFVIGLSALVGVIAFGVIRRWRWQRDTRGLEKLACLALAEPQIRRADLGQLARQAQLLQAQRHIATGGQHRMHVAGKVRQPPRGTGDPRQHPPLPPGRLDPLADRHPPNRASRVQETGRRSGAHGSIVTGTLVER